MHPFDGLFDGRQIIDTVGLTQNFACLLGWSPWLPLATALLQRNTIPTTLISGSNQNGFAATSYQHILFLVDCDTFFGENGDVAIVGSLAHTQQGRGKILKRVCFCRLLGQLGERQPGDILATTGAAICYADMFGRTA